MSRRDLATEARVTNFAAEKNSPPVARAAPRGAVARATAAASQLRDVLLLRNQAFNVRAFFFIELDLEE